MSWQQALGLALGGIPLGSMYALQAMGIVLVYKTSRVFNFAQGAIGMAAAYVASFIGVSWGIWKPIAILMGLVVGVGLGIVIERYTIRHIQGSLQKTVATLAWLLALQGVVQLLFTDVQRPFLPIFPNTQAFFFEPLGLSYGYDQVGVMVITLAITVGLGIFFRKGSLGLAMRAVADAPEGARLLGIDVNMVTLVSWGLGAGMAALSGILVSPLLSRLDTVGLVIFTVQALAAALIGRLQSLPLTFAGGVALGMSQPVLKRLLSLGAGGDELIAFVFVLGALMFRRQTGRKDTGGSGLPPVALGAMPKGRWAVASMAGIGMVGLVSFFVVPAGSDNRTIAVAMIWSLGALSLVLLAGVAGQVSLCQATFMGVGGYVAAIAMDGGVPFIIAIIVGGFGAALAAAIVGLPALRLQDLELAIVTLSLAFAADRYFFNSFTPLVTGDRTRVVERPSWLDGTTVIDTVTVTDWRPYALLCFAFFVMTGFAVASLRRGRSGGAFTALRSSEAATSAMGFSVISVKLQSFALSGFVAGIGGALFAGLNELAGGTAFGFDRSITLLAYVVIAGLGSVPGAAIGGAIVALSAIGGSGGEVASSSSAAIANLLTAAVLLGVLIFAPRGLAGLGTRIREALFARASTPPAPDDTPDDWSDDVGPDVELVEPQTVGAS